MKAWDTLKLNFVTDGRCQYMMIHSNFLKCNIWDAESIRTYTNRLSNLVDKLAKMSKSTDDLYVCYQLIRKMSEEFQLIIQFLPQLSDSEFMYMNSVSILLARVPN